MENLNNTIYHCYLPSEEATKEFAQGLYHALVPVCREKFALVYLDGHLGSGKSTFCRAFIKAGSNEHNLIPSPTYSIQEIYDCEDKDIHIHHFDLYRVHDFMDLQAIGVYDHMIKGNIFLVEWPQIMMEHFGSLVSLYLSPVEGQPNARNLKIHVDYTRIPVNTNQEPAFKQHLENLVAKFLTSN